MFIRSANPIWFFNNLTGQPLDDTYWAFFLTNTLPYLPQAVFQDPNGTTPWSDPIEFQPSAGLPNNLYFDPNEVYRIEIRKGNTQADPLIWLIENFVPNGGGSSQNTNFINSLNLITNPQFALISFASPFTIKLAGTYDIAPGWQLVLQGSGTTTLTQVNLPGQDELEGNPPYALEINNNGWNSAILQQTFSFNGALFSETVASNGGSVSMSILAEPDTTAQTITLNYVTSEPYTKVIKSKTLPAGLFSVLSGVANIVPSNNANLGSAAFTQAQIILQPTGKITITNVQFIGQSIPVTNELTAIAPDFQEETIERQVDHLFHYYANSLLVLPKKSLAVGWHFRNNPWQFNDGSTPMTISTTPLYTADQTIVVASTVNSITVSRTPAATAIIPYGLLKISAINAIAQGSNIGIFQFIDSNTIRPFFGYRFSILVRARIVTTGLTQVKVKARIFTANNQADVMTNIDPIASWNADGDPVFSANYSGVSPDNDPSYTLQNNFDTSVFNGVCPAMAFNNFFINPNVNSSATVTVGVLVYTVGALGNGATPDYILIDEITLVPNPFAQDTIAQTADEVLRECQFYYEKSHNISVLPTTVSLPGAISGMMSAAVGEISPLNAIFKVTKRIVPIFNATPALSQFNFYSPDTGTIGKIRDATAGADLTVTNVNNLGQSGASWPTTAAPVGSASATVTAQWVCDVRPGLI